MDTRNTRQKTIVLETLMNMYTHPTIQQLYQEVLKKDSTIGQATVYRNVNKLLEEGKIRKVPTNDNMEHYDGNCAIHYHFHCNRCHKISDLYEDEYQKIIGKIEKEYSVRIEDASFLFEGICEVCNEEVSL